MNALLSSEVMEISKKVHVFFQELMEYFSGTVIGVIFSIILGIGILTYLIRLLNGNI